MPTFSAPDGTLLAYRVVGDGDPVVRLPGGPTDSAYLGGLSAHRRLILLDPRGTGRSAIPDDTASCRRVPRLRTSSPPDPERHRSGSTFRSS